MAPLQREDDSVIEASLKTVTALTCVVHNTLACSAVSQCDNCELWRKYLHGFSSLLGNTRKTTYMVQHGAPQILHRHLKSYARIVPTRSVVCRAMQGAR